MSGEQSLTGIGDYAFSKCSYLHTVNGNKLNVKTVGMYAFAGCSMMNTMTFDGDVVSSIRYGAFSKTSLKELVFTFEFAEKVDMAHDSLDISRYEEAVISVMNFDKDCN